MPSFNTEVPHSLGRAAAKSRLETFLAKIEEKYQGQINEMTGQWEGDTLKYSFTTFGIKIAGTMEVQEDQVVLHGDLPFSAMMFKGKIASSIKEGLERTLQS